jgi:hypothetical protein
MLAEQMAEETPLVTLNTSALEAARMLATHRLPGLIVTDAQGQPYSVLPASQVVRFIVPGYVQDDPSLARVLSESMADQAADTLASRRVSDTSRRHGDRGRGDDGPATQPTCRGGAWRGHDRGHLSIATA